MYLYSLLQHYKNWKPNNTHSIFSLINGSQTIHTAPSASQINGSQTIHIATSASQINGIQTIHIATSALQNIGARQYTQHLQLHTHTLKKKWEPDNTHSIFRFSARQDTHTHTHLSLIHI